MRRAALKVKQLLRDENEVIIAVIALGLSIQEVYFGVMPEWLPVIEWIQIGVIFLLLLEWLASLYLAEDRKAHLSDRRVWAGLIMLGVCLLAFDSSVAHILAKSPWLKILRISPALLFGFLTARPLFASNLPPGAPAASEEMGFRRLELQTDHDHGLGFAPISEADFCAWVADPNREGCRCAIDENSGAITGSLEIPSIPSNLIRSALSAASYPRISRLGTTFVFAASIPVITEREPLQIELETVPFAFLCTSKSFLLAESHPAIGTALGQLLKEKRLLPDQPLQSRLALATFSLLISRYEEVADRMANAVRHLMMMPMTKDGDKAYKAGFNLQKALARLKSDMWRLGHIFERLEKGTLSLPFENANFTAMYESFSDTCDFTSEAFAQSHEAATSTIDLRMNLASFQMNRFMGLLAVVTAVGIIPATMSGFLGMNIQGTNFPVTIDNVAYWAVMLIVLALYFLKTRGWLKF